MALSAPHLEDRRRRREERLQRERARRRTQMGAAAVVVVAVLAVIAYAVISGLTGSHATGAGASPKPTDEGVQSSLTTASSEPTKSSRPSTPTPPKPTESVTPTGAADATASLDTIEPLSPAPGIKTIVVNKKAQTVTLYKADGTPVDRFPCASGVIYPRVGTYEVFGKRQQSWSLYDDTTFYYFTKFETSDKGNSIGFHSIPVEPDGTLVGGLGKPVSHGCVRLDKKKAKFVYEWAAIGTKVIVKK